MTRTLRRVPLASESFSGSLAVRSSAPPLLRSSAPPLLRSSAPPLLRSSAPPLLRSSAPTPPAPRPHAPTPPLPHAPTPPRPHAPTPPRPWYEVCDPGRSPVRRVGRDEHVSHTGRSRTDAEADRQDPLGDRRGVDSRREHRPGGDDQPRDAVLPEHRRPGRPGRDHAVLRGSRARRPLPADGGGAAHGAPVDQQAGRPGAGADGHRLRDARRVRRADRRAAHAARLSATRTPWQTRSRISS
jgi:hypothetical protein